jgi:hypothetical protein
MTSYNANVNATANSTINTEDTWIEVQPPSGVSLAVYRIRVSFPHTTVSDVPCRIRLNRASAAGATGTSFTPKEHRPAGSASASTCNVKNGTSAFSIGTVVDTLIDVNVNTRGIFEWVARDEDDYFWSGVNERIALCVRVNLASMVLGVEMDWKE